jgi:uracil-DNA glycosylase family 4
MRQEMEKAFADVVGEVETTLLYLSDIGVSGFDCSPNSLELIGKWDKKGKDRPESLSEIRDDLGDCRRCRLSKSRHHIVFGAGNPHAELVFVGEGPGYDEDRQGVPFVGAAGKLLTKIILAMELTRDQVYICNVVKCRPPQNRNPKQDEIETCLPFLSRQLAAMEPQIICALGTIAAQTLLSVNTPISKMRGRFYTRHNVKVLPTYHPAYLLRNSDKKREVWDDMKKIMHQLNRG